MNRHPTLQTYEELEQAFDFFNKALFDGRLPHCLLTLQRQHDTYGYFSRDRFVSRDGSGERTHEIALNPSYFAVRTIPETLSVLVREMVSLDQTLNGNPGRRRYHNKEWADMLEEIGLVPTDTGLPGGKRTGEKVEHYIIDGGPFDIACRQLVDEQFTLSWVDRFPPMPEQPAATELAGDDPFAGKEVADGEGASSGVAPSHAREPQAKDRPMGAVVSFADVAAGGSGPVAVGVTLDGEGGIGEMVFRGSDEAEEEGEEEVADAQALGPAPAPMKRFAPIELESLEQLGVELQPRKKSGTRAKYKCPTCDNSVWGKPGLRVGCYSCADKPAFKEV